MRTVRLYGALGEQFGRSWSLDVATPAEALRAIDANCPGFFRHLVASADSGVGYQILLDDRAIETNDLQLPFGRETFRVVPVIAGAGNDAAGIAKTVVGVILVAASIYFSGGSMAAASPLLGISYGSIAMFGVAMALSGVSQLMAGTPQGIQDSNPDGKKPSYYFNGPVNVAAQGGPVPIGIGRMIVGSVTIDGGIDVNEIPL